mmetsp:Transcript_15584/g.47042  ORF Transcript_15584/g.47042 Transcript_15584/m.47042 type:complete len:159 (+) Transcript_15584:142-618(+)
MASPLARFARAAARLPMPRPAAAAAALKVHTVSEAAATKKETSSDEQPSISPDVYAPEKHQYDHTGREDRFPSNVHVPEGGPRVSFPDHPTISRHSLMDPGYGSFGHSMREPAYQFVPTRHLSSGRAPPIRRRRTPPQPAIDDGVSEFAQAPPVHWLK